MTAIADTVEEMKDREKIVDDLIQTLVHVSQTRDFVKYQSDLKGLFDKMNQFDLKQNRFDSEKNEKISVYLTFYGSRLSRTDPSYKNRLFAIDVLKKALEYCETNYAACVEIAGVYNEISKFDVDFLQKEKKQEYRKYVTNYLNKFEKVLTILDETNSFVEFSKKYNPKKGMNMIASAQFCVEISQSITTNMRQHETMESAGHLFYERCCIL